MTIYVTQTAQGTAVTATGTVTLAAPTTAGNTLIALASTRTAGTVNATLQSVAFANGVVDNFGYIQDIGISSATQPHTFYWLDPLCAGGQTKVVFTTTGGVGALALTMDVLEVGGMLPIQASPAATDVQSLASSSGANWGSGTTAETSWPTEIWVGFVSAAGTRTITGPGYPWINLPQQANGTTSITMAGYQVTPSVGQATYSGTFAASLGYSASVLNFPGMTVAPVLPGYLAGAGVQQGDTFNTITAPLGFAQQRTVFRAAQLTTTTSIPAGPGTQTATIAYDTIFEDPYQGWNTSTHSWSAPFSGLYLITFSVSVTSPGTDIIVVAGSTALDQGSPNAGLPDAGGVMPVNGGVIQGQRYTGGIAGQAAFGVTASHNNGGSPVVTSNSPGSTVEITWLGYAIAGA